MKGNEIVFNAVFSDRWIAERYRSIILFSVTAYFGSTFHGKEEAAFSNLQLFGSLGYVIIFIVSSYVRTRYKIYLLMCSLILGMAGYFTLEYKHRNDRKIAKESENKNNVNNEESILLNKCNMLVDSYV